MKRPRLVATGVALPIMAVFVLSTVWAFNIDTHERVLNRRAAQVSILDNHLKGELGFSHGLSEVVAGGTVQRWIEAGGAAEDQFLGSETLGGAFRARHHFHNPVEPWDRAGLSGWCGVVPLVGEASVRWAQEPDQGVSGRASWGDARRAFLRALTLASRQDREAAWASAFQILGQQLHLIADLASPAHVRNDPHCLGDGFEAWASRPANTSLLQGLIADQVRKPDPAVFTLGLPIGDEIATVPVARLWDTDRYAGASPDPDMTLSPSIGLAEYTNANFLSRDAGFGRFPFPAPTSVDLVVERDPKTGEDRAYFKKLRDGERNYRLAVPTALFNFLPDRLKVRRVGLDDAVFGDYAVRLLPRAVGYSAALLDYFFRGRLDVDLVNPEAGEASLFQLTGTNASGEALVEGTLSLYADNPAGVRSKVETIGSTVITNVASGGVLSSALFQPPEDAERFVAVYEGTLGGETGDPGRNVPGGVVGKVLGGVRVEEVFSDGIRWRLRTPKGVFLLPLTAADFEDVRWGDGDDILVARGPFGAVGPGQPSKPTQNLVAAYEIQRVAGSVDVQTVDTPGGLEVVLGKKEEAVFPFGMPLGTTVNFSHTIHYRQQIAIYQRREVFVIVPDPNFPDSKTCAFDHFDLGTTVKPVAARDVVFQGSFPITLDLGRNRIFGTVNQPYVWELREVGATAAGRVLGLVVVSLTYPEGDAISVPVISLNRDTGAEEVVLEFGFAPAFPPAVGSAVWALVDLKTAEVVASTADPVLTLAHEEAFEGLPDVWTHAVTDFCGQVVSSWSNQGFVRTRPGDIIIEDAQVQVQNGLFALTANGWLKGELNGLVVNGQPLFGVQLATRHEDSGGIIYDCISSSSGESSVCRFVRVSSITGFLARGPAVLDEVRRARPAPGGERLVFLAGAGRGAAAPAATVIVWDAAANRAEIRHQFLEADDILELGPATGGTLLAATLFPGGPEGLLLPSASFLIPLEGTQGPTIFAGVDLRESFVLLNPSFLYSVGNLKFFRSKPPLLRTALPAKLADLPDGSNPVGDYHAVRAP